MRWPRRCAAGLGVLRTGIWHHNRTVLTGPTGPNLTLEISQARRGTFTVISGGATLNDTDRLCFNFGNDLAPPKSLRLTARGTAGVD